MKIKVKKILSITFTLIAICLSLIGITLYFSEYVLSGDSSIINPYLPFTLNSNIFLAVVGLIYLIVGSAYTLNNKNAPQWLMQLKLASVTAVSVTAITVATFIAPVWNLTSETLVNYQGANFFLHVLVPIISIIGFIFFDVETRIKWRWNWCSVLPVLIYGGVYLSLIYVTHNIEYDIYYFLYDKNEVNDGIVNVEITRLIIVVAIMLVGTYILANILWAINLLFHHLSHPKVEKDEIVSTDVTLTTTDSLVNDNQIKNVTKTVVQPAKKEVASSTNASVKPASSLYNGSVRVYHISTTKSLLGKWQVKLAGGEKAIKVFATQEEAIHYTRGLVSSQGGSIRLHSLDGRIRKI